MVSTSSTNERLPIHAPHGTELSAKSWQTEGPLRMLMNNLDPEVAERPEDLVVYGGTGKAARTWAAYDAILASLRDLEDDETLLVQSGKPVGVMRTHAWAPRVLIANSNLVGDWANWEEFRKLDEMGLIMYGQMTAGSWIYIGTQGILQGTFETFAAIADKKFGGTLAGTITVTAGLGGMGGAQPLAVTMNDGVAICIDVDQTRITRRIEHRYLDEQADSLEDAVRRAVEARDAKRPLSIGVLGNAAELLPQLLEMKAPIDVVTDQTSAHDPLSYLPVGVPFEDWHDDAERDPAGFTKDAQASMAAHVRAMVEFQDAGAEVFDYGNSIRDEARKGGYDRAFEFPGFVPAYIRPLFCEGKGPFRWAALSGDPADIAATDRAILELFPENERLRKWITMAGERVQFQGLPARICWLGYGERHLAGLKFNEMVASGELKAPLVIGRDHLDCGSVASPYRETEAMLDGSDAIADWAILNALVNTASGASWVSFHHGGGVGMGRSLHAGQVCVADGTDLAAAKIERVLTNDPGWVSSGTSTPATTAPSRWPGSAASGCRCPRPARTEPATGRDAGRESGKRGRNRRHARCRAHLVRGFPGRRPRVRAEGRPQPSGSRASTRVPASPPEMVRVPPTSAARSRIEAMPTPGVHAEPSRPPSHTVTTRQPPSASRTRSAVSEPLWRAALVSASIAIRYAAVSTAAGRPGRSSGAANETRITEPSGGADHRDPLAQRRHQPELVEGRRPHVVDQPTDLAHRGHGVRAEAAEQLVGRLGLLPQGVARRVRGERDAGQRRSQPVVEVATQPATLLLDRRDRLAA